MLYLSFSQAKRYERCGELARQWKEKLVKAEPDQKKFFTGRVVHRSFELWLTDTLDRRPLVQYLNGAWAAEEAALAPIPMALRWVEGERQSEWVRAQELLAQIETDASGLLKLSFVSELRARHGITAEIGMYAQPDLLGVHPTAPVLYVVELKSGSSYDPDQVDWYSAVLAMTRKTEGHAPLRYIAVALRPATETTVSTREVTVDKMLAQIQRAHEIGKAMLRGEWEPKAQAFCSMCEGRDLCPDYQMRFGQLAAGRVSF